MKLFSLCNVSSFQVFLPLPMPSNTPVHTTSEKLWKDFAAQNTNAFRVCTFRDGWIERLGDDVLLSYRHQADLSDMLDWVTGLDASTGFHPARVFGRNLPVRNEARTCPALLSGDSSLPLQTTVSEAGVRYGLDFSAGYSAGLFVDQRLNRQWVQKNARGRFLNTFAYTCSFSVCAALSGAQTVSVDLSRKSLSRGEANFRINGLDPGSHRFFAADVREFLPRLVRKGERFDTIILDPPTFSTSASRGRFRVEDDMETLILAALELSAPRARVLVSTNCTRLECRDLERLCRTALKQRRLLGTPRSCPYPDDFPPGTAARCIWLDVGF
jgi:23S rRNA (cytosine1962-C5)-methyltransferase